jgi:2',3'-cyclic-nucleotide 2'-phosphodiesterase (5'-nucleotidase family)
VLGGHLHIVTNPPKLLPNGDDAVYCQTHDCSTLLVHSGAFAKYVGRLDLVVHVGEDNSDPEKRSRIVSYAYDNQPVATYPTSDPKYIPDDPAIANLMWPYSVKLNQDINLNGVFAFIDTNQSAGKILRNDPSGGDSQLGNLVARAMQTQQGVDAQFSFTNSLGVRADFEAGALTNEQMFNVFPFENTIVVMYLSGQEIQDTLDFVAAKSATRGCQTQLQAAGITFDMVCRDDPTAPNPCAAIDPNNVGIHCDGTTQAVADAQCNVGSSSSGVIAVADRCDLGTHRCIQTACAKNIYLGDHCRPMDPSSGLIRSDLPVDPATTTCAPLSMGGLYRVAVNNYIAAGGSGFFVLKRNTSQQDTGISLRDALTVYLSQQSATCPARMQATNCTGDATNCIRDMLTNKYVFDEYGKIACLDETLEPHDGRIRPVSQ